MTGGVDKVENIGLAVVSLVVETHRAGFYGDAALAFELHVVEELFLHVTRGDCAGLFEYAIRKRGFSVIYVCDYAEIAYFAKIAVVGHKLPPCF